MCEYIPSPGDVVYLISHNKVNSGNDEKFVVLVISPYIYNAKTGLMLCCPVTAQIKGYPFETLIDDNRWHYQTRLTPSTGVSKKL
ncbi:type II toxin-antitoxin system PemK/MazF family toxin (plasmid) [Cronobacter sakazakii]|nr:type II toxin-antitoxin system PemK/MazF family toxin [Cronobacter sakazakii]